MLKISPPCGCVKMDSLILWAFSPCFLVNFASFAAVFPCFKGIFRLFGVLDPNSPLVLCNHQNGLFRRRKHDVSKGERPFFYVKFAIRLEKKNREKDKRLHFLERPCASQQCPSMGLRRPGRFFKREVPEGRFLRRGGLPS